MIFGFLKKGKFGQFFLNHAHVPDRCGPTKKVIEKKKSGPATENVGLTEKHKVGNIWSRVWPAALANFKLHKVLQYFNWTDNQGKTESLSPPVGQKSIL